MLSSNIFRYLDEPRFTSFYWPDDIYCVNRPAKHNNIWSTSIPVVGYGPNEIAIKEEKDDNGQVKIVIHAKHEAEDEYCEFRKCVKIPKNVDHENLRTILSKEGVVIVKGPYKNQVEPYMKPIKLNREDTWNGIWGELGRLNDQMSQLVDDRGLLHRPRSEFVSDENGESGLWRIKLNVGKDFKSDEIKLRSDNNAIHLEAKKELKNDNCFSSRYFQEVISIPDGVEMDKLRSKLMENGELVIEAPCKKIPNLDNGKGGKPIPIDDGKGTNGETMSVDN